MVDAGVPLSIYFHAGKVNSYLGKSERGFSSNSWQAELGEVRKSVCANTIDWKSESSSCSSIAIVIYLCGSRGRQIPTSSAIMLLVNTSPKRWGWQPQSPVAVLEIRGLDLGDVPSLDKRRGCGNPLETLGMVLSQYLPSQLHFK